MKMILILKAAMSLIEKNLKLLPPSKKRRIQSTSPSPVQASTTTPEVIRPPQPGHPHLPPPPPIFKNQWPALLVTKCLSNLNQSLTTFAAGISPETSLIRKR
ncbi:hypothetical protein O181_025605 [Austropuccinia psidii MF-1]|uniref:Uncharacterized protein n=1 Tax=Austropuccinia psidii MF-1 TaxID=1389203 RepID=A0A9Q3H1B7_9BASI|nr:hypothetical protein [Austropuccinia psidii MF-1]